HLSPPRRDRSVRRGPDGDRCLPGRDPRLADGPSDRPARPADPVRRGAVVDRLRNDPTRADLRGVSVPPAADLERRVARLLRVGTYASIALLAAGVTGMAAAGRSPLDPAPRFDPARILADLGALRPEGFLWLGIAFVMATPSARVVMSLIGYLPEGDR